VKFVKNETFTYFSSYSRAQKCAMGVHTFSHSSVEAEPIPVPPATDGPSSSSPYQPSDLYNKDLLYTFLFCLGVLYIFAVLVYGFLPTEREEKKARGGGGGSVRRHDFAGLLTAGIRGWKSLAGAGGRKGRRKNVPGGDLRPGRYKAGPFKNVAWHPEVRTSSSTTRTSIGRRGQRSSGAHRGGHSNLVGVHIIHLGRRCGLVVQRANSLMGGRAFDPEPRQPLSHSTDWCFTPLPGSGWQVLFDSQYGSIGSKKSDTLQKLVAAGQPAPAPRKKKIHLV
jgi:hypothetical protein